MITSKINKDYIKQIQIKIQKQIQTTIQINIQKQIQIKIQKQIQINIRKINMNVNKLNPYKLIQD